MHVVGYDITEPVTSVALGPLRFEAVKPELLLADRMIGFKHWPTSSSYGQHAMAMLAALGSDMGERWLRERLRREGALDVFDALRNLMARNAPITVEELESLKRRLLESPPPTTHR